MATEPPLDHRHIEVTPEALHRALERAADHRRRISRQPGSTHWNRTGTEHLTERITWQCRAEPIALADGWFVVGVVLDELVEPPSALAVWWHPATDRVRIQRPRPFIPVAETPPPDRRDEPNPFIR
ncbi:MAG TPA: hypothetical protein VGT61_08700 [Thermomicrobiales bacterium]|jgi:hypothetical protein|nr:hypothetical protein [Thermomicrobiales bacterium]